MPYIIFFQILIKKHHTDAVNQKKRKRTESPKEQPILNTKRPTKRINYEALDDTSFDDYLGGFDESLAPAQLSSHPNPDGKTYPSQPSSQFNKEVNTATSHPNADGKTHPSQSTSQFNEQKNNSSQIPSQSTSPFNEQENNASQIPTQFNEQDNSSSQIPEPEIDWKEEMIQEMLAQKLRPIGIMKILYKFILIKKLPDDFTSISTIRRSRKKLLNRKIEEHSNKIKGHGGLAYMGCDARKGKTLMPKNQMKGLSMSFYPDLISLLNHLKSD